MNFTFIVHTGRAILYVITHQQFERRLLVDNESAGNGQCSYMHANNAYVSLNGG